MRMRTYFQQKLVLKLLRSLASSLEIRFHGVYSHVVVNTYLKTSASTQFASSLPLLLAGLSKTTIKAFSNRRLSTQKT